MKCIQLLTCFYRKLNLCVSLANKSRCWIALFELFAKWFIPLCLDPASFEFDKLVRMILASLI